MPNQNSMILSKNKFKCRKCEETLELKHLVWFVKHYKFCGVDDVKVGGFFNSASILKLWPVLSARS